MTDYFSNRTAGLESPPAFGFAITPNDTTDLGIATRGIMVTTAGNVSLITVGGDTVTLPALQPGVQYAIRATRIRATDTTATGLVGLA